MKRRSFLRRLGIGAAAVVAAPKIIEAAQEEQVLSAVLKEEKLPPIDHFNLLHEKRPRTVATTSPVVKMEGRSGVYEVELDSKLRTGDCIYVPERWTNKTISIPVYVLSTRNSDFRIRFSTMTMGHEVNSMPVGTILVLGGSAYIEPI